MKCLNAKLGPCRQSPQGFRRHFGLQVKIELIEQVRLGLEVGEE